MNFIFSYLLVNQVLVVMGMWHIISQGDGSRGGPHLLIGGIRES